MKLVKTLLITFCVLFSLLSYCNDSIPKELSRINDSLFKIIQKENDPKKLRFHITELLNKNYLTNHPFVVQYIEENILDNPVYMKDTVFYANTINTYAICFLFNDANKCIEIAKKGIDYLGKSTTPEVLEKVALLSTNLAQAYASLGHYNSRLKVYTDIYPIILKTKDKRVIRH